MLSNFEADVILFLYHYFSQPYFSENYNNDNNNRNSNDEKKKKKKKKKKKFAFSFLWKCWANLFLRGDKFVQYIAYHNYRNLSRIIKLLSKSNMCITEKCLLFTFRIQMLTTKPLAVHLHTFEYTPQLSNKLIYIQSIF